MRPMPREPPVTRALRPEREKRSFMGAPVKDETVAATGMGASLHPGDGPSWARPLLQKRAGATHRPHDLTRPKGTPWNRNGRRRCGSSGTVRARATSPATPPSSAAWRRSTSRIATSTCRSRPSASGRRRRSATGSRRCRAMSDPRSSSARPTCARARPPTASSPPCKPPPTPRRSQTTTFAA